MKLYKVLVNGKSAHGGDFKWSLPRGSKKGKWHSVPLPLVNCVNGFHLTDNPAKWALAECEVFEAETDGQTLPFDTSSNKICVEKVRLVRKVEPSELLDLFKLQIVTEGYHKVSEGLIVASGSASVEASGSASVRASGSASVEASGSASVRASGSASVKAFDSASVRAFGSASVKAFDSVSVRAFDSASVKASGSVSVRAFDSASVKAFDSASVRAFDSASVEASGSASVIIPINYGSSNYLLKDKAVCINRKTGKLESINGSIDI